MNLTNFEAILLALTQGFTEFLPVSSTGHLMLMPYVFNFESPGNVFFVALHMGTLLAVLLYFRKDWIEIFTCAVKKENSVNYNKNTLWFLVLATIPGVIFGLYLSDSIDESETFFPPIVALMFVFNGTILYLADYIGKKERDEKTITKKDALIIGFAQAIAIIPEISRSGLTMATGLFLGLNRVASARFSFLMSTPIILGAGILEIPKLTQTELSFQLVVSVLISFIAAHFTIKYMLKFIQSVEYKVFFWYSLLLSLIIMMLYFYRQ